MRLKITGKSIFYADFFCIFTAKKRERKIAL